MGPDALTLADLVVPVPTVPAALACPALEVLLRGADAPPALLVEHPDGRTGLLARQAFLDRMAGRCGFGRALHHRAVVGDVDGPAPRRWPAGTPVTVAAQELLGASGGLPEVLLVGDDGGALGVVASADLLPAVAGVLAEHAGTDPLTGLANRRRLLQALSTGTHVSALLCVDLDRFKAVNDTYGHEAGDVVLRRTAERLGQACPDALVARLGGDEFAVVLADVDDEGALRAGRAVVAALDEPVVHAGRVLAVGASVGVHVQPVGEPVDATLALRSADLAMYAAKRAGGRRVRVGHDDNDGPRPDEAQLRRALAEDELVVHLQPVRRTSDSAVVGAEALVRWQHPRLGLLGADAVVGLAESTGWVREVGRTVLRQALAHLSRWPALADGTWPTVSVNASAYEVVTSGWSDSVAHALAEAGVAPSRLVVEVTETAAVGAEDVDRLHGGLAAVRALGVAVSLDDFGTGTSSLVRLAQVPADELKLDRSLVAGLPADGRDVAVVSAVVGLAHDLGLAVVGEGVERPAQLQALRDLGVERAQGYALGRPGPPDVVAALLGAPVPADEAAAVLVPRPRDDRSAAASTLTG